MMIMGKFVPAWLVRTIVTSAITSMSYYGAGALTERYRRNSQYRQTPNYRRGYNKFSRNRYR